MPAVCWAPGAASQPNLSQGCLEPWQMVAVLHVQLWTVSGLPDMVVLELGSLAGTYSRSRHIDELVKCLHTGNPRSKLSEIHAILTKKRDWFHASTVLLRLRI